jgi:phospholipid transport system substrate-binding protein
MRIQLAARILMAIVSTSAAGGLRAEAAEPGSPTAIVESLNAVMLDVMKNAETLGYAGRRDKLMPALDAAYDVPFMAEKVVGRHWDKLSEDERQRWVALFREFLAANYAGRFNRHSGQSFETLRAARTSISTTGCTRRPRDGASSTSI